MTNAAPHAVPGSYPRRIRRAPVLWMLAAAAAQLAVLVRGHFAGEYDATAGSYGMNHPGDLPHFLRMGALELLVLTALLRPWSYRHAWGRALLALVIWIPWALFAAIACMHCGPIGGALMGWRFGVVIALSVTLIVSAIARRRAGRAKAGAVDR